MNVRKFSNKVKQKHEVMKSQFGGGGINFCASAQKSCREITIIGEGGKTIDFCSIALKIALFL